MNPKAELFCLLSIIGFINFCECNHAVKGNYPDISKNNCGLSKAEKKSKSCFHWRQPINHQSVDESALIGNRLSGGENASFGEFPWMVRIYLKYKNRIVNRCGGAIINEHWVITAAHCLYQNKTAKILQDGAVIMIGSRHLRFDNTSINLFSDKLIPNEKYLSENDSVFADIGLIKVDYRMKERINKGFYTINSICLPKKDIKNYDKEKAIISGWYQYSVGIDPKLEYLKKTELEILPWDHDWTHNNWDHLIAVKNYQTPFICMSDSGSPLIQYTNGSAVLIGITATAYDLAEGQENKRCKSARKSFVRISKYIDWIRDTIASNRN